jgi:hypothetical protein
MQADLSTTSAGGLKSPTNAFGVEPNPDPDPASPGRRGTALSPPDTRSNEADRILVIDPFTNVALQSYPALRDARP